MKEIPNKPKSQKKNQTPQTFWSRRRFIQASAVGGLAITALKVTGYQYKDLFSTLHHLSATEGAILFSVVEAMLPDNANKTPKVIQRHVKAIDQYLFGIPKEDIRQIHLLLYGLEHATVSMGFSIFRFSSLSVQKRRQFLSWWQTSSIGLLRLGLESLKSMVFMAYYRTADAFRSIGYPGPIAPGFTGPEASRKRYSRLLAPPEKEPGWS